MSSEFYLEATFRSAAESMMLWHWSLTDQAGTPLAFDSVCIDMRDWQLEAYLDLPAFVRAHSSAANRTECESRVLRRVAEWLGARVFGDPGTRLPPIRLGASSMGAAIVQRAPCTVRLVLPSTLAFLADGPLESATYWSIPLGDQGVGFVFQNAHGRKHAHPRAGQDRDERSGPRLLRVLSSPDNGDSLATRDERILLDIVAESYPGDGVHIGTVEHRATRDKLTAAAGEHGGWDIVHLAGHGDRNSFVLEDGQGGADPVSVEELAALLQPAKDRLQLVVLAACASGGGAPVILAGRDESRTPAERIRSDLFPPHSPWELPPEATEPPALRLAWALGCHVVGMRYPVTDSFLVAFVGHLYAHLLLGGTPLLEAVGIAAESAATAHLPQSLLSIHAPVVYAAPNADLPRWPEPEAEQDPATVLSRDRDHDPTVPRPLERFVGRGDVLTRVGALLASESAPRAIELVGMPGIGKSACLIEAVELNRADFEAVVWWDCAETPTFESMLALLTQRLTERFPGDRRAARLRRATSWEDTLDKLSRLLRRRRVLVVADHAETTIATVKPPVRQDTPGPFGAFLPSISRKWSDPRIGGLFDALCPKQGHSRLLLGVRYSLRLTDKTVIPLPLLTDTAAGLLEQDHPLRVPWSMTQGHPGLLVGGMYTASASGKGPTPLEPMWTREAVHTATDLTGNFNDIGPWLFHTLVSLPDWAAIGALVLSCLAPSDRLSTIAETVWPSVHGHVFDGRPAPAWGEVAAELVRSGIVTPTATPERVPLGDFAPDRPRGRFVVHPALEATLQRHSYPEIRAIIDEGVGALWVTKVDDGLHPDSGTEVPPAHEVGMAAAASVPYLSRSGQLDTAVRMLRIAVEHGCTPRTARRLVPFAREIALNGAGQPYEFDISYICLKLLNMFDQAAARVVGRRLGEAADAAFAETDFDSPAGDVMISAYVECGRSERALAAAKEQHAQALPGSMRELNARSWIILLAKGSLDQVRADAESLLRDVNARPVSELHAESQACYRVLEAMQWKAQKIGDWEIADAANRSLVNAMTNRGASGYELACARLPDVETRISLGFPDRARRLVLTCCEIFEDEQDWKRHGMGLCLLAKIDGVNKVKQRHAWHPLSSGIAWVWPGVQSHEIGRSETVRQLYEDGLRSLYRAAEPGWIATVHHNFAHALADESDSHGAVPHHLAATLIAMLWDVAGFPPAMPAHDCRIALENTRAVIESLNLAGVCDFLHWRHGIDLAGFLRRWGRVDEAEECFARMVADF